VNTKTPESPSQPMLSYQAPASFKVCSSSSCRLAALSAALADHRLRSRSERPLHHLHPLGLNDSGLLSASPSISFVRFQTLAYDSLPPSLLSARWWQQTSHGMFVDKQLRRSVVSQAFKTKNLSMSSILTLCRSMDKKDFSLRQDHC